MTPAHFDVTNQIAGLETTTPDSGTTSFGILSGTQGADLRTKLPAETPAPTLNPAIKPPTKQSGEPENPRRCGRPRSIDHEKREKILAMLENGFSQPICAAHVGVSLRTLRREMARDAEFRERALRAETLFEQWPLMTIIRAARNNWRAASWLIANMPHVSVRRRKREEKLAETQSPAASKVPDPIALLSQWKAG